MYFLISGAVFCGKFNVKQQTIRTERLKKVYESPNRSVHSCYSESTDDAYVFKVK